MKYLHTMIRVTNLEKALHFYTEGLGFKVHNRQDYEKDRFTLVFLRSADDEGNLNTNSPMIELTHNWDTKSYTRGDAYGHVAYQVDSIEKIQERLKKHGYDLSWGPGKTPSGKTRMAFIDDPDGYEIELLEYST
jgi:lactoylglutathione lyase